MPGSSCSGYGVWCPSVKYLSWGISLTFILLHEEQKKPSFHGMFVFRLWPSPTYGIGLWISPVALACLLVDLAMEEQRVSLFYLEFLYHANRSLGFLGAARGGQPFILHLFKNTTT